MAAIALGKSIWAYWDLCTTTELDPKNKEVTLKLQELQRSLHIDTSNQQSQNHEPKGLGMHLAASRKKLPPKQDTSGVMKEMQTAMSILQNLKSSDKSSAKDGRPPIDKEKDETALEEKTKEEKVKIEQPKEVKAWEVKDIAMMETDSNHQSFSHKTSNLAESTYRFRNRRRPDSFITISKKHYQIMIAGKTIQCWNSKFGSWMSIRVIPYSKDAKRKQQDSAVESMKDFTMLDGLQQCKVEGKDNQTQFDSIAKKEHLNVEGMRVVSESSSNVPQSEEAVMADVQQCNVTKARSRGQYRKLARAVRKARMHKKRTKMNTTSKQRKKPESLAAFIHNFQDRVGVKRKTASAIDYIYRPRKKVMCDPCTRNLGHMSSDVLEYNSESESFVSYSQACSPPTGSVQEVTDQL